jgi:GNAT superfamily N-acetyltransferase
MGIRLAGWDDLPDVERIVHEAYAPWVPVIGAEPAPMTADYAAAVSAELVHVLENGAIDGLIVLIPEEEVLFVENVAVRPDRQGRGLGRRLLAFAEHRARTLGLPALRLYTNERMASNVALYAFLGFRETGRGTLGPHSVVHMRRDLSP